MKIGIASDHRGYNMKEKLIKYLKENNYTVVDYGTTSNESDDFPIYGFKLGEALASKQVDKAIAICGTGIGIGIAMNKVKDVICAKVSTVEEARLAREHNHANSISISGEMSYFKTKRIVKTYLEAKEFTDEKYERRVKQIKEYEDKKCSK